VCVCVCVSVCVCVHFFAFSCIIYLYIYMLQCTCHDWSDESCVSLLKNCNKALEENGKVIIIDYLMPEVPESSVAAKHISVYDNAMVFNLGGKERTEKEFEALSKSSGFSGFQVVCRAYNALGVMELYK
jgi:hypothetical protein